MKRESSSEHVRKLAVLHQNQLVVQDLMKRELPAVMGCKCHTLEGLRWYYEQIFNPLIFYLGVSQNSMKE